MNAKFGTRATVAFLTALDRIAAADRQPTCWEAGCLYAALCAMAIGNDQLAEQKICLCALGDLGQAPPVTVVPSPTVDDLQEALHAVRIRFVKS